MGIKFSNLASTTLASSVTSSATSITVADGSVFPTLGAGDYFYATIDAPPSLTEIVKVTARSGNTLTVVRAQDNTTATTHASGDEIALRVVSAVLEDIASAAATESVSISGDTMTGALTVGGNLDVNGSSGIYQRHSSGGSIVLDDTDTADASTPMVFMRNTAGALSFGRANRNSSTGLTTGSTDSMTIDSSGNVTLTGSIKLPDNKYLRLGNNNDLILYHNGTGSYIQSQLQDADIHIRGNDGGTNFNALSFDMSAAGAATFNANVKVNKQLLGGFGSVTTSGTLDWNHVTNARSGMGYSLLQGGDTNGPELGDGLATSGGGAYYHITNWEYSSTDGGGNLTQVAIPYHFDGGSGKSALSMRSRYSGTWTGWYRYLRLDVDAGTATIDGAVTADNYLTSGYLALSAPSTANNYALVDINDSTFDFQLRQYNGSSWVTSLTIDQVDQFATFSAGASFAGSVDTDGLSVSHQTDNGINFVANDTTGNSNFSNVRIDYNVSGSDTLTGDRAHIGLEFDVDSSASGGNTSEEHRLYSIYSHTRATGDSDLIYGAYFNAEAQHSSGQVSGLYGVYGRAEGDSNGGTINGSYGVIGASIVGNNSGTHSNAYGVYGKTTVTAANADTTVGNLHGGYFEVEIDPPGAANVDVAAIYGVRSEIDNDGATDGSNPSYDLSNTPSYLFYGNYAGTLPGNPYGLYILDDVPSYIRGKLGLGTTNPTRTLMISSDDDLTAFTGTSYGAMYIRNSDYVSGEYTAIDFGYNGTQNPVGRIALRVLSGGSTLSFGTSNNYSAGVTNEALTIDALGKIGVNTSTPDTIFEIRGADPILTVRDSSTSSNNGNATLRLAESGASDTLQNYWDIKSTAGQFQIIDNWDEGGGTGTRLTISDAGRVGIGTASPSQLLHVNGHAAITSAYSLMFGDGGERISGNNSSEILTFFTGATERMRLDPSGNLGLGTGGAISLTTPDIAFVIGSSSHTNPTIQIRSSASGTGRLWFGDNSGGSSGRYDGYIQYSQTDQYMQFGAAAGERMRLRGTGSLLLGTTTQYYGSTDLNVGNTSDATNGLQITTSTSGNGYVMFGDGTSSNAYRGYVHYNHPGDYLRLRAAGSERLRCDSGGVNVYGDLVVDSELYFNTSLRVGLELTGTATATVGPGWMTVATNTSGRRHGEILVTDADSGDHALIRIDWIRSYADSNFTVLNCGGHSNRITGARVISEDSNNTYGTKLLQVYVSTSSTYDVALFHHHGGADYTQHSAITPVIEDTKSGYSVHGAQIEELDDYSLASEEGIQAPQLRTGAIYANTTVSNDIVIEPGGSNGSVDLRYAGSNTRLKTESSGVTVTGDVLGVSNMYIGGYLFHNGDTNTYLRFIAADDMQLVAGGRQMLRMDEGANPDILAFVVSTTYTDSSGNIVASGNITAYASDERLKTNIRPIENAIDKIKAIRGVHYDWIDDVEDVGFTPDRKLDNVGVIAQEIEEVLPQVVKPAPFDRERSKETNWEFVSKSGEDYKTVDYDKITALLIQGMKEQQELIEALEAKIKNLEEELL